MRWPLQRAGRADEGHSARARTGKSVEMSERGKVSWGVCVSSCVRTLACVCVCACASMRARRETCAGAGPFVHVRAYACVIVRVRARVRACAYARMRVCTQGNMKWGGCVCACARAHVRASACACLRADARDLVERHNRRHPHAPEGGGVVEGRELRRRQARALALSTPRAVSTVIPPLTRRGGAGEGRNLPPGPDRGENCLGSCAWPEMHIHDNTRTDTGTERTRARATARARASSRPSTIRPSLCPAYSAAPTPAQARTRAARRACVLASVLAC
jgi:hypothetical protein